MNQVLFNILTDRLTSDPTLDARVTDVLFAACQGRDELKACLNGGESGGGDWIRPKSHGQETAGAYLTRLKVQGFRGIGAPVELNFRPGPGLTLVVGRNGTGKSSFAEGLELLLTGDTLRWSGKAQVWSQCWRNLHHPERTSLEAVFLLEGQPGPVTLHRAWPEGTQLDVGTTVVRRTGQSDLRLADIGWSQALQIHRPILSYNEMGSMFSEGPSKLYDALSAVNYFSRRMDSSRMSL